MSMFGIMSFIFPIMFIFVIGIFILTFVQGISTWNKNNHSSRLTVPATVVAKREDVSHHHANCGDITGAQGYHTTTNTSYYVTFQGTRYLSFEREF